MATKMAEELTSMPGWETIMAAGHYQNETIMSDSSKRTEPGSWRREAKGSILCDRNITVSKPDKELGRSYISGNMSVFRDYSSLTGDELEGHR